MDDFSLTIYANKNNSACLSNRASASVPDIEPSCVLRQQAHLLTVCLRARVFDFHSQAVRVGGNWLSHTVVGGNALK